MQNFLAGELSHRRNGQYAVVREPELTRKARPDIRLRHPRCRGPVTIELKVVERWTLRELEAALRDQLVGTYMAANESAYGILVLCSSGQQRRWNDEGGQRLDFPAVLARLRRLAQQIAQAGRGVERLDVVAIDFHD